MFGSIFENMLVMAFPGEELPSRVATSPMYGGKVEI